MALHSLSVVRGVSPLAFCAFFRNDVQLRDGGREEFRVPFQLQHVVGVDDDDQVVAARPFVLVEPERLTQQALDAVAFDGVAHPSRYAQPQPVVGGVVGQGEHGQGPGVLAELVGEDGLERAVAVQAVGVGELEPLSRFGAGGSGFGFRVGDPKLACFVKATARRRGGDG